MQKQPELIHFEFKLHSSFCVGDQLAGKYSIEYLNDWLSYESELKYLFFFGESSGGGGGDGNGDEINSCEEGELYPSSLEDSICLLRHNNILTDNEKRFILSLCIEDVYVFVKDTTAVVLHVALKSSGAPCGDASKIVQFLCNHIYNQCQLGILKHGLIQPLSEAEKVLYEWQDEPGWSCAFLDKNPLAVDALFLSHFTCLLPQQPQCMPTYISNYNLACYEVAKSIDSVKNDLHRYKKSIKYLHKKQKELRKEKHALYKIYRDNFLAMALSEEKKWHFVV